MSLRVRDACRWRDGGKVAEDSDPPRKGVCIFDDVHLAMIKQKIYLG